jgi:hypothetical protein
MGATIRPVATFSTKADIKDVIIHIKAQPRPCSVRGQLSVSAR